jgi:ribosome-associated protein YbcJ (S4-like RNA binding protein)
VSEAAKARMLKTDQFMERQSAQTSGAATKNIISEKKCIVSGEIIK